MQGCLVQEKVDRFDAYKLKKSMIQKVSRKRVAFRDPVTGEKSYHWADKISCRYDNLEKMPIIMEFFKGGITIDEVVDK